MLNILFINRIIDFFNDLINDIELLGNPIVEFIKNFTSNNKKKLLFITKLIMTLIIIFKLYEYYNKNSKIKMTSEIEKKINEAVKVLKNSSYPTVYVLTDLKGIFISKIFIIILNIYSLYSILNSKEEKKDNCPKCDCQVNKLNGGTF